MNPGSFVRIVVVAVVVATWPAMGLCPENLDERIQFCAENQTPMKNRKSLLGIDMERLRMMCSEFDATVKCLLELTSQCPEHSQRYIESKIDSLERLHPTKRMYKLCSTKDLYEKYSLHYFCISRHRKRLHQCYRDFEKSVEPFVRSHVMTSQDCSPVDALMSCAADALESCGGGAAEMLRSFVAALMPGGFGDEKCAAVAGEKAEEKKSPEKTSPEHYKVLYKDDNENGGSRLKPSLFIAAVALVSLSRFLQFPIRGRI